MRKNPKIKNIDELAPILVSQRAKGKVIVQCHGIFDLLHVGHIRHFEQAKRSGDILVVTLTPDRFLDKGPHRPSFREDLRAEAIASLECVDHVAINKGPTVVEAIQLLRPHVYAKVADHMGALSGDEEAAQEESAIRSVGGRLAVTEDTTFGSSTLIDKHFPAFPKEAAEYLTYLGTRHGAEEVVRYLQNAQSLRVLLVGEAIIDEYQYCETIGKSGKEPILATRYISSERFAGGVLAAANNVAAFCNQVSVLTFLGMRDSQEDFVREKLDPKIERMFLYMDNAPTIVKRRFVEVYPLQKLFEVYVMGDSEGSAAQSQALCAKLREVLPKYDVVIAADYGHGMIGPEAVDVLCGQARFLAVNAQVNAENRGFNTVSKYHRADYICVSENEIRLEARSRRRDLRDIVAEVARKLSCEHVLITRGQAGCLCYDKEESFSEVPAFTSHVVDRIGAGDAVLAVTALCVAQKAPMEVVGFISNAVGAQAVATVGHRSPIERVSLFNHIESLLKSSQ